MKENLTVKHTFNQIGLKLQGLPDMRDRSSVFEVKNRLYREDAMEDVFRHADHAQLLVSTAVCLPLLLAQQQHV